MSAEEFLVDINEKHDTIESAELLSFSARWKDYQSNIPIDFIDFYKIHLSVTTYTPEVITDWKTPLKATPELQKALGPLVDLTDAYVDYVNTLRRTLVLKYLVSLTSTGYLDEALDSEGNHFYMENKDSYNYASVETFIENVLEAQGNYFD